MILADVGNRHIHIFFQDGSVLDLNIKDAIDRFGSQEIEYISVNRDAEESIKDNTIWKNVSEKIQIVGEYEGMGVDRKALCLSRGDGIYIDAGSAITIDRVDGDRYIGGMIFPGIYAYKTAFATISERLVVENIGKIDFDISNIQRGTENQIKYSVLKPIVDAINSMRDMDGYRAPLYITGGDRAIFDGILIDAHFSNSLVFEGIKRALMCG
jgi:type III pantothenate kinase